MKNHNDRSNQKDEKEDGQRRIKSGYKKAADCLCHLVYFAYVPYYPIHFPSLRFYVCLLIRWTKPMTR